MRSNRLLLVVLLLLLTGCAPKVMIMLDGLPAPTHAYVMANPATSIQLEVVASSWHYKDRKTLYPCYLTFNKKYTIKAEETEFIELSVTVYNPKEVWYILENWTDGMPFEIYSGKGVQRRFTIRHNVLDEGPHRTSVVLKDKDGFVLMELGEVIYETKLRNREVVQLN
jgi:hypothetical protein